MRTFLFESEPTNLPHTADILISLKFDSQISYVYILMIHIKDNKIRHMKTIDIFYKYIYL